MRSLIMPYSDNNPERRNLTVLSLAIIVYRLADGHLLNKEMSLTLINIGFENQQALIFIMWFALVWFLFRYVVTNRKTHGRLLEGSWVEVDMDNALVKRYLQGKNQKVENYKLSKSRIHVDNAYNWQFTASQRTIPLVGFVGYFIIKLYLLKIVLKHRATTDYYTPYILFTVAVYLGFSG